MSANQSAQPQAYSGVNEIAFLEDKRASKIKLLIVTIFLACLTGYYYSLNSKFDQYWMAILSIWAVLLFALLICQFLRRSSVSLKILAFENLSYSIILTFSVIITGVLNSPILFFIFLIPFLGDISISLGNPVSLASFEVILLGIASLLIPSLHNQFTSDSTRYLLTIFSTLLIGVGVSKLQSKLDKLESEKQTATKMAEDMSEQKIRIDQIIEVLPDGFIVTSPDGFIVTASRKALEILKTTLNSIVGQNIKSILPIQELLEKSTKTKALKFNSFDGETIMVELSISEISDEVGKPLGKIFLIKDVTDKNHFEDMKMDFVTIAAHELRTPLTSMRNYLSVLTESANNKLDPTEKQYLQRATISTKQIFSLIENLLNVSKIEGGKLKFTPSSVDLENLVKEVLTNLMPSANQKQIHLTLDKDRVQVPNVLGDKYLIGEVINNLVDNAINFSPVNGFVRVMLQVVDGFVIIHVNDTGIGMAPADMEQLFTKFYRVAHSLVQHSKGIGLGLYLSKAIVEAHGGRIWANSIEGKGATFSFTLPQAREIEIKR